RLAIGTYDGHALRIGKVREDDLAAAGQARSHTKGVPDGAPPGINRQLHHFEIEQSAELRRKFEPGLVSPVIRLHRAPHIGGKFRSPDNLIDNGGYVMLPYPGSKEAEIALAIGI